MIGKTTLPKWFYDFNCRECENLKYVNDPSKNRNGEYCIPVIEAVDRRPANWTPFNEDGSLKPDDTNTIYTDEHDRHVRCNCFKKRESLQLSLF